MATGQELADRMVEKLFSQRRKSPAPTTPLPAQQPPLSVQARIEDSRKARTRTARKVRGLRLF